MQLTQMISCHLRNYCTRISTTLSFNAVQTLKPGDQASITKTITNEDIQNFAKLTGDYNPIHIDSPKNIIHGALLNSLVSSLLGTKLPGPGTIVIEQNLRFPNSSYAGDTIEAKVEITSVRKLIKCEFICTANGEKIVLNGTAVLLKR